MGFSKTAAQQSPSETHVKNDISEEDIRKNCHQIFMLEIRRLKYLNNTFYRLLKMGDDTDHSIIFSRIKRPPI